MKEWARIAIRSLIAAVSLLFVFAIIMGFVVRESSLWILSLTSLMDAQIAFYTVSYTSGIVGATLSGVVVLAPFGWILHKRAWIVGVLAGIWTSLFIFLTLPLSSQPDPDVNLIFAADFIALVISSALASESASRFRRDKLEKRSGSRDS